MESTPNIWSDEWEFESDEEWAAGKSTRLPRGDKIGATVAEIAPDGTSGFYHFHHGAEELLVVLRGRPTLREPAGERALDEGDVVHFAVGPEGAHQLLEPHRRAGALPDGLEPPVARSRRVSGHAPDLRHGVHRVPARASTLGHAHAGRRRLIELGG